MTRVIGVSLRCSSYDIQIQVPDISCFFQVNCNTQETVSGGLGLWSCYLSLEKTLMSVRWTQQRQRHEYFNLRDDGHRAIFRNV